MKIMDQHTFILSTSDVEVVVDVSTGTPVVLHWGPPLGMDATDFAVLDLLQECAANSDTESDRPRPAGIWRERGRGFLGTPALNGHRASRAWSPLFVVTAVRQIGNALQIESADEHAQLAVTVKFELSPEGVLLVDQSVTNTGSEPYELEALSTWLPVPDRASRAVNFHGHWAKERQYQERSVDFGTWSHEVREGRSGHAATIVHMVMTEGTNFGSGELWAIGLRWSGNSRHLVEKIETGRVSIGAGELLEPGEIILGPGDSYRTPGVSAVYSGRGFDGMSEQLHEWVRARPNHPTRVKPRPLTLNVWEAVYFDHRLPKLLELLDIAAGIGVERFVLDDGWFGGRRDDHAGLGDWIVSEEAWPDGLHPLIDAAKTAGLEFGLWFEGEMVNPDSDLYRAHPDWILNVPGRIPLEGRNQHVLDLVNPDAFSHVLGQVDAILTEYDIDYIKWDHNKVLFDPGHEGIAAVHRQTEATYRLFDELKRRHPGLEIESCASGGGRIDLGMLDHSDRFWTSDCNDPIERQFIQRFTGFAIPPELLGSHIGPTIGHQMGRKSSLSFRAITALFGHAGLEWDLTETSQIEREQLAEWVSYYKTNRELLHSGTVIRMDYPDASAFVHGVVSKDRTQAIFAYAQLEASEWSKPSPVTFRGLDPVRKYKVRRVELGGPPQTNQWAGPSWQDGIVLSGASLQNVGLKMPILRPANALLFEVAAIG